jgi:hypothetical protein
MTATPNAIANRMSLTEEQKAIFLTELARTKNVTHSARVASGGREGRAKTFRDERHRDAGFDSAWRAAEAEFRDKLQAILLECAEGRTEIETHGGSVVYMRDENGNEIPKTKVYRSERILLAMARSEGLIVEPQHVIGRVEHVHSAEHIDSPDSILLKQTDLRLLSDADRESLMNVVAVIVANRKRETLPAPQPHVVDITPQPEAWEVADNE